MLSQTKFSDLPLVSIGVASYNNSMYILETLKSITSQSYKNIELIIVDDCSKDNSIQVINEFLKSVTIPYKFYINETNKGVVSVCNKLLDSLTGKYYTLIGSDDIMLPNRIRDQLKIMLTEKADMTFGRINIINENSDVFEHTKNHEIVTETTKKIILTYSDLIDNNIVAAPTVMLKTETVRKLNGYSSQYTIEDLPLWISLAKNKCNIVYFNEILVYYRMLPTSLSNNINTPLSHFLLFKNYVQDFSFTAKWVAYVFWLFKLTGISEFKNAYKYSSNNASNFIKFYSFLNQNKFLHYFFYKFLKILTSINILKNRYLNILNKPL